MSSTIQKIPLFRSRSAQRGASDLDTLFVVLLGLGVLAIGYIVLEWFKGMKDEKVDRAKQSYYERRAPKKTAIENRGPRGYTVTF